MSNFEVELLSSFTCIIIGITTHIGMKTRERAAYDPSRIFLQTPIFLRFLRQTTFIFGDMFYTLFFSLALLAK